MKQGKLGLLLFIASLPAAAVQLSTGAKVHAQLVDLRAAAEAKADGARAEAKAETARQARALASPSVQHPTAVGAYVVFDVPGAANGTFPTSINLGGAITGYFIDAGQVFHGFLRAQDGAITTFDVPFGNVYGTAPVFISQSGAITGNYADANFVTHGFVRATNCVVTTFDAPGAVNGTNPEAISSNGEVAGFLWDANFVGHGFVRAPNGKLSTFDAPGAGTTTLPFPQGTYPLALAANGTTYGNYANGVHSHGFLRTKDGAFTSFDAPGDTATFAAFSFGKNFYVNPGGVIAGAYFEPIAGNPLGGISSLHPGPRRDDHYICCSDLFPVLHMVVPHRDQPWGRDRRVVQRRLYHQSRFLERPQGLDNDLRCAWRRRGLRPGHGAVRHCRIG